MKNENASASVPDACPEEFHSDHCCHWPMPVLCSSQKSGLWQQENVSVTEISIAVALIALGQGLMQLSGFQANLGVFLLLIPRLIIFKNRVAFLNENHVTKLLLMGLGSKPGVLFQVSRSCMWWLCKFMTPKCIYLMRMCVYLTTSSCQMECYG